MEEKTGKAWGGVKYPCRKQNVRMMIYLIYYIKPIWGKNFCVSDVSPLFHPSNRSIWWTQGCHCPNVDTKPSWETQCRCFIVHTKIEENLVWASSNCSSSISSFGKYNFMHLSLVLIGYFSSLMLSAYHIFLLNHPHTNIVCPWILHY